MELTLHRILECDAELSRGEQAEVCFAVKLRVVRFIFLENVVDGSRQHFGNSADSLFVATTLFECKVMISGFRELLGTDRTR